MFDYDPADYEVEYLEVEDEEIRNSENIIDAPTPKKRNTGKQRNISNVLKSNKYEFESLLLDAVFERPPLFDYTIPIKSRTPAILNNLWQEVCEELKTKFEGIDVKMDMVKDMYKNLRNNYTRYKSTTQKLQTSGSEFKNIPEPRHLTKLRHLDAVLIKRAHKSNFDGVKMDVTAIPSQPGDSPQASISEENSMELPPIKRVRTTSSTSTSSSPDFLAPLNKLVDKVGTRPVGVVKDMEHHFGEQVAIFLRGLGTVKNSICFYSTMKHIFSVKKSEIKI